MRDVHKAYGATVALRGVSLDLAAGSVLALLGENGAGKSTLMKILGGVVRPDRGEIALRGRPLELRSPRDGLDQGISTVFQELSLLPNLTVAENMFLGREPARLHWLDRRRMDERTRAILADMELDVSPRALVSSLTLAERQFVEIARVLSGQADVLILDEPTAALGGADVERLNRQIRRLQAQGKGIIYISHRLEEVFDICDTVTVLKDGRNVDTRPVADVTPRDLVAMMVGRDLNVMFPDRDTRADEVAMEVTDLVLREGAAPVSFTLRQGEILGLAGLEGQGQQEILRAIFGLHRCSGGRARLGPAVLELPLHASGGPRHAQRAGVGFLPEDRKDEGLFLDLRISDNLVLGKETAKPEYALQRGHAATVREMMAKLAIKAASAAVRVGALSGGNQQKVLLGRVLASQPRVMLIEEPTRGVDIGAKAEIYRMLRDYARAGGAVVVLSREALELIGLCDRLLVVHDARIVAGIPAAEATEHAILEAAFTS